MVATGEQPSQDLLRRLRQQLNTLVAVLTVADLDPDVRTMLAALADTAVTAEPLLANLDPSILIEIRSAFDHAEAQRIDDMRASLLMASRRLSVLPHTGSFPPLPHQGAPPHHTKPSNPRDMRE